MTPPKPSVQIQLSLTQDEQELCLKFCFERTFKTAIDLLAMIDTKGNADLENKVEVCADDIEQYMRLERIRNKIVEGLMRIGMKTLPQQPIENREWDMLAIEDRPYVLQMIRECFATKQPVEMNVPATEKPLQPSQYYAYPQGHGGIAWGRNGKPHGYNTHRGVISDPKNWLETYGK